MSRAESPEARAERILTELRDATREAAGMLKDLKAAAESARRQVDEYLGDECQRALDENQANLIGEVRRVTAEHEAKVIERVIQFAALIENNFSREALIQEAEGRIMAELESQSKAEIAAVSEAHGEVVIRLCDRPHAD